MTSFHSSYGLFLLLSWPNKIKASDWSERWEATRALQKEADIVWYRMRPNEADTVWRQKRPKGADTVWGQMRQILFEAKWGSGKRLQEGSGKRPWEGSGKRLQERWKEAARKDHMTSHERPIRPLSTLGFFPLLSRKFSKAHSYIDRLMCHKSLTTFSKSGKHLQLH